MAQSNDLKEGQAGRDSKKRKKAIKGRKAARKRKQQAGKETREEMEEWETQTHPVRCPLAGCVPLRGAARQKPSPG